MGRASERLVEPLSQMLFFQPVQLHGSYVRAETQMRWSVTRKFLDMRNLKPDWQPGFGVQGHILKISQVINLLGHLLVQSFHLFLERVDGLVFLRVFSGRFNILANVSGIIPSVQRFRGVEWVVVLMDRVFVGAQPVGYRILWRSYWWGRQVIDECAGCGGGSLTGGATTEGG